MATQPRGNKDGVNVQVILRCRPYSKAELSRAEANRQFVKCKEESREVNVFLSAGGGKQLERSFHFDKVFAPESGQERLYTQAVSPIVEEVLEGFNCTIFAYGQTGTGKTYTMEGGDRDSADGNNLSEVAGVIPRAIHQIFTTLDHNDSEYTVKCSFLELYNEETTDLLAVGERQDQKLRIMEDRSGVVIQGLEEFIVKSAVDIYALLDRGSAKRKTAETQLNKQSSRSHSVFCITVHMREIAADGEEVIKIGKLYLVDLAGSENVSRSGAAGTMAKEAGSINKSLLTLGRVITALVEGSGHIPYRDSKLTRLLRDSLGGKTKTCIIATIAPTAHCQDETLSTLDYAHRAKNIRNRPEVNQKISKTAHIKELNAEIDRLKAELFATREKNGVYLPVEQYEQREELSKSNVARLENLELELEQIAAKHKARNEQLAAEISRLQQELAGMSEACDQARLGIQERDFLIATRKRSENAIITQASNLTSELQQASAALDGLYQRLEEDTRREQGNAAVVQELRQTSAERFAAMLTSVTSATESAQGFLEDTSARLGYYLEKEDAQKDALRGRVKDIHSCLNAVLYEAEAATDAMKYSAQHSLASLRTTAASFVEAARRADAQAAAENAVKFQSLASAQTTHKGELDACAASQREGSAALLGAVQATIAQGGESLRTLITGAEECRIVADGSIAAQNSELAAFGGRFHHSIAQEKEELLHQMEALLSSFAAKKQDEVEQVVHDLQQANTAAAARLSARSAELHEAAKSAQDSLKLKGQKANLERSRHTQQQEEQHAALLASLEQAQTHSEMLRLQMHHHAGLADQGMESHLAAVSDLVTAATDTVSDKAAEGNKECAKVVRGAQDGCKALEEACERDLGVGMAVARELFGSTDRGKLCLEDFATSHQADISQLASCVHKMTVDDFAQDPHSGLVPAKAAVKLPPPAWFEEMRTPSAEILLAEFRQHLDGVTAGDQADTEMPTACAPEKEAEGAEERMPDAGEQQLFQGGAGAENADPNLVVEPRLLAKSRIPGAKERVAADAEHLGSQAEQGGRRKRLKA